MAERNDLPVQLAVQWVSLVLDVALHTIMEAEL